MFLPNNQSISQPNPCILSSRLPEPILTTLTAVDPYAHSTHLSSTPTSALSPLYLLCQTLPILVDPLGYFDWLIGAPAKRGAKTCIKLAFSSSLILPQRSKYYKSLATRPPTPNQVNPIPCLPGSFQASVLFVDQSHQSTVYLCQLLAKLAKRRSPLVSVFYPQRSVRDGL